MLHRILSLTLVWLMLLPAMPAFPKAKKIIKDAIPATVFIVACRPGTMRPVKTGSGVIVHEKGYLLTNFHNAGSTKNGKILYDLYAYLVSPSNLFGAPNPRAYRIKVLKTNFKYDLLLGRITGYISGRRFRRLGRNARFPAVSIADSSKVEPTDQIYALGYPALARTTRRIFSGITVLDGKIIGLDTPSGWIKSNAEISPGNSGGPAINNKGELVGINSAVKFERRTQARISLIRPINLARHLTKTIPDLYRRFKKGRDLRPDYRGGADDGRDNNTDPFEQDGADGDMDDSDGGNNGGNDDANDPGGTAGGYRIRGRVRSVESSRPIQGALCVLLRPNASLPFSRRDIIAYGRSNYSGRYVMNRRVPRGRYLFVAVHDDFQMIKSLIRVHSRSTFFTVTMAYR